MFSRLTRRTPLTLETLEERLVLNNRFVVPVGKADGVTSFETLQAALAKPGLIAGDVIQIDHAATPGSLDTSMLPGVPNLTIAGDASVRPDEYAAGIQVNKNIDVLAANQGLTFKHVWLDFHLGELQFSANGTVTDSYVTDKVDPVNTQQYDIRFFAPAGELSNSTLVHDYIGGQNTSGGSVDVASKGADNHVHIVGNTFYADFNEQSPNQQSADSEAVITYFNQPNGSAASRQSGDLIARNHIYASTGFTSTLIYGNGIAGLTIADNDLHETDLRGVFAMELYSDPSPTPFESADIHGNRIDLATGAGIHFGMGQKPLSYVGTPVTFLHIYDNVIHTRGDAGVIGGPAIFLQTNAGAELDAKVEGNDLTNNGSGVCIQWDVGEKADIDLGGGDFKSLGGNNFRTYTTEGPMGGAGYVGAIVCLSNPSATGTVAAYHNIFQNDDPESVIQDSDDGFGSVNVQAGQPLLGNAAFVETLYLHFLHRPGDTTSLADAGGWVSLLNNGFSPQKVIDGITRSQEAYLYQANESYWKYLGRQADNTELTNAATWLGSGGTLEALATSLLASKEFQARYVSNDDFVRQLYFDLLGRPASKDEISGWTTQLQQGLTRDAVASQFLGSKEYRQDVMTDYYLQLLHRVGPIDLNEIDPAVGSVLDQYSLGTVLTLSQEYYLNG
jgi:hypothetical protein